jgi:phenylacetate-CoA ligase
MPVHDDAFRPRAELERLQGERLARMLDEVLPRNPFQAEKFRRVGLRAADVRGPADLAHLPFTTKAELLADQRAHPPYGTVLTYPAARYTRMSQTSGTQDVPLRWLDTPESWEWMLGCWEQIFHTCGVTAGDRLLFPFSFGPFLGFWTAFDAAQRLGCLCLAAGGMSSGARLRMLRDNRANVVLCTPTYALHLAQVAREQGIALGDFAVKCLIVAGEPGGSIPATKQRIEQSWQARLFDHSGLTEVGPVAIECPEQPGGLHVLESDYVAEVIDPATGAAVPPGQPGELVLTNLGRWGSPLLRYRTGDLVRADPGPCPCGRSLLRLGGGILGRTDDMVPVRGNNFYPAALEGVLRRFPEVVEYRVEVDTSAALAELRVEVEPDPAYEFAAGAFAARIADAIRDELFFRAEVTLVPPGALPRFEMKARRVRKK